MSGGPSRPISFRSADEVILFGGRTAALQSTAFKFRLVADQTVFDDGAVNELNGSDGVDWFFANVHGSGWSATRSPISAAKNSRTISIRSWWIESGYRENPRTDRMRYSFVLSIAILFARDGSAAKPTTYDGKHGIATVQLAVVYFVPKDRTPLPDWKGRCFSPRIFD